jgi:hypothetical protein
VAISQRSSTTDAAFAIPLVARLPDLIITGLAQRSIPAARSVASQPYRRVCQEVPRRAFAIPTRLLSFTAPWPLPCRDFHSLGRTAFHLVTQWNKIEHRLFCHITENWRGRPLVDHETNVQSIGSVRTTTGLRVKAKLATWTTSPSSEMPFMATGTTRFDPDFPGSLDHVVSDRGLKLYFAYYNANRTHLALGKDAPVPRPVERTGKVVALPQVGGLHHLYRRLAA